MKSRKEILLGIKGTPCGGNLKEIISELVEYFESVVSHCKRQPIGCSKVEISASVAFSVFNASQTKIICDSHLMTVGLASMYVGYCDGVED